MNPVLLLNHIARLEAIIEQLEQQLAEAQKGEEDSPNDWPKP